MFVNPFPFGNTNGIVDTIRQGLPGVCLTGAEVHSHIDEGLFKRFGLPEWLIAKTTDEYVSAVVRLAQNSAEREELSRGIQKIDVDAVLFKGNPELFVRTIDWLHATHKQHETRSPGAVMRPPFAAMQEGAGSMTARRLSTRRRTT
jgi:predicted O-linked N-acetylglucosamine transferase (SPINDLY family)